MTTPGDRGFDAKMARIEALIGVLDRSQDPGARAASRELVGALLDLHGEGLAKILDLASGSGDAGRAIASAFARDGLVAGLLLLHGLHPEDLESRVRAAMVGLAARLGARAEIDLVGLEGDVLRLRLPGGCGGCPSSGVATRRAVEDALLAAAPDLSAIEFVDEGRPSPGPSLLPIITL